jgi:hypothetical protein
MQFAQCHAGDGVSKERALEADGIEIRTGPTVNGALAVVAKFDRFGNGPKRLSDFEVEIHWSDVEELIAEFSKARHAEAMELRAAMDLMKAIRDLGWRAPENSN